MCYGGCKQTCENCKPKFVKCPSCGTRCLLLMDKCFKCGTALSQATKDEAIHLWEQNHAIKHDE